MLYIKNILIVLVLFVCYTSLIETATINHIELSDSQAVYLWTKQYSHEYKIPEKIAYNILKRETDWSKGNNKYNAKQMGDFLYNKKTKRKEPRAFGPYQIHLKTAIGIWKDDTVSITKERLLKDIQFNVHTAIKIIKHNHDYYHFIKNKKLRWKYAITTYNTGIPNFEKNNRKVNKYGNAVYSKSF